MKHLTLTLLLSITLFTVGCTYQEIKGGGPGGREGLGDAPQIPGLDFEAMRTQIFNNPNTGKCSGCHGAWANDYAGVKSRLDKIRDRVNRSPGSPGFMPKDNSPLAPELKAMLFAWMDSGAPEVVIPGQDPGDAPTDPTPPPPPLDVEMNWASISQNIIQPYCIKCHTEPDFLNDGVVLVTYEDVFRKRRKIKDEVEDRDMPKDTRLPDELLTALIEWIDQGAPEN